MARKLTQKETVWLAGILGADYPHPLQQIKNDDSCYFPIGEPILFVRKPYPHHFFVKIDQVDKVRYAVGEFASDRNLFIDDVVGYRYLGEEETNLLSRELGSAGEGVQFYSEKEKMEEILSRYQLSGNRVYER